MLSLFGIRRKTGQESCAAEIAGSTKKAGPCVFRVFVVLFVVALGAAWVMGHHVIRTKDGVVVLEKRYLSLNNSYVDVRTWQAVDFRSNTAVKDVLVRNGYGDLVLRSYSEEIRESVDQLVLKLDMKLTELKIAVMETTGKWVRDMEDFWCPRNG